MIPDSVNYECLKNLMVVVKANPKQGRATAESNFSYLWSPYFLEYMMAANHALFEKERVFGFHVNLTISNMISMFKLHDLYV